MHNPHLWYNPATVRAVADALIADLGNVDPKQRGDYQKARAAFLATLEPLDAKVADMRKKYAGRRNIASEPVFGYTAELLGLKVGSDANLMTIGFKRGR